MFTGRDTKILREGAYNKALDDAIQSCNEYIARLEGHKDPGGFVTGPDFNVQEIGAVQDIVARIKRLRIK